MTRLTGTSLMALSLAALLGSLSFVAWRQARALEALEQLDEIRAERSLLEAERTELTHRVEYLESRGRIQEDAWSRLRLRVPHDWEVVNIQGNGS